LPPSCADFLKKPGSLNLLEPPGPVKAYNGIALPSTIHPARFKIFDFSLIQFGEENK
jgi:hypothetical protein